VPPLTKDKETVGLAGSKARPVIGNPTILSSRMNLDGFYCNQRRFMLPTGILTLVLAVHAALTQGPCVAPAPWATSPKGPGVTAIDQK
jgi:hypothetical protein